MHMSKDRNPSNGRTLLCTATVPRSEAYGASTIYIERSTIFFPFHILIRFLSSPPLQESSALSVATSLRNIRGFSSRCPLHRVVDGA